MFLSLALNMYLPAGTWHHYKAEGKIANDNSTLEFNYATRKIAKRWWSNDFHAFTWWHLQKKKINQLRKRSNNSFSCNYEFPLTFPKLKKFTWLSMTPMTSFNLLNAINHTLNWPYNDQCSRHINQSVDLLCKLPDWFLYDGNIDR